MFTVPLKYAHSFYGVVDILSILPTYISIILPATRFLLVIRSLRLLRVFRILKLVQYIGEAETIKNALYASFRKIIVFIASVATLVVILGSVMYVIEGKENGFTSIPKSIYWAVVTLTTVGYGDISPQTVFGQFIASIVMITGYGIIAVPTGIVTAEFTKKLGRQVTTKSCPSCGAEAHDFHATYCYHCGVDMEKDKDDQYQYKMFGKDRRNRE